MPKRIQADVIAQGGYIKNYYKIDDIHKIIVNKWTKQLLGDLVLLCIAAIGSHPYALIQPQKDGRGPGMVSYTRVLLYKYHRMGERQLKRYNAM